MCSAIGFEYWSGCGSSTTFEPMPVRSCQTGPEKFLGSSAWRPDSYVVLRVAPLYFLAAWTARKAELLAGPSVEAFMAVACACPSGVDGSARSTAASAARLVSSPGTAARPPPSQASRPRNSRRDVSPRTQASTSSDSPASSSRRSRSPLIVAASLAFSAVIWTSPVGHALPRDDFTAGRGRPPPRASPCYVLPKLRRQHRSGAIRGLCHVRLHTPGRAAWECRRARRRRSCRSAPRAGRGGDWGFRPQAGSREGRRPEGDAAVQVRRRRRAALHAEHAEVHRKDGRRREGRDAGLG